MEGQSIVDSGVDSGARRPNAPGAPTGVVKNGKISEAFNIFQRNTRETLGDRTRKLNLDEI